MAKMNSVKKGTDHTPAVPPNFNPTILDLPSRFFSSAPNEELFTSIRDASKTKLEGFLDAYREFASNGQLQPPQLDPGILRSYLSTDPPGSTAAWLCGSSPESLWQNIQPYTSSPRRKQ